MTSDLTPEEFYNELSPRYDDAILRCVPRYKEMLWAIVRYIPDELAPKRVLDIGVGSGNLSQLVLERYAEAEVVGVDISREMLAVCRKRLPNGRLTLEHRDFRHLGFEDNSFDLVVSSISIHHIDDSAKQTLFLHLYRLLRPGGRATPRHRTFYSALVTTLWRRHDLLLDNGRHSSMSTTSPVRHSLFSSWT